MLRGRLLCNFWDLTTGWTCLLPPQGYLLDNKSTLCLLNYYLKGELELVSVLL